MWVMHGWRWLQHVTAHTLYQRKNLKIVSLVTSRNVLTFTANVGLLPFKPCRYNHILSVSSSVPHSGQTAARLRTATSCLHVSKLPQAATTHDTGRSFPREHHRHGHARKLKEVRHNHVMSVEFGRCMLQVFNVHRMSGTLEIIATVQMWSKSTLSH